MVGRRWLARRKLKDFAFGRGAGWVAGRTKPNVAPSLSQRGALPTGRHPHRIGTGQQLSPGLSTRMAPGLFICRQAASWRPKQARNGFPSFPCASQARIRQAGTGRKANKIRHSRKPYPLSSRQQVRVLTSRGGTRKARVGDLERRIRVDRGEGPQVAFQ
jgi:hypothetical protein